MSSAIKLVKRAQTKDSASARITHDSSGETQNKREIVSTVKSWIAESRDRRRAEAKLACQFVRELDVRSGFEVGTQLVKACTTIFVTVLILLCAHPPTRAQSPDASKTEEEISVAKTSRLPSLHLYTLFSGNLAKNDIRIPNPAANQFPGLGPFFLPTVERKPSAVFATTVVEPPTQQYRIRLNIKRECLSHDLAQAKLREEQNDTIDKVKKTYYAILRASGSQFALMPPENATGNYTKITQRIPVKIGLNPNPALAEKPRRECQWLRRSKLTPRGGIGNRARAISKLGRKRRGSGTSCCGSWRTS